MAIELKRADLSRTDLLAIKNNLTITVKSDRCRTEKQDYMYEYDSDTVRVPFAYNGPVARCRVEIGSEARGFVGELRDKQKDIATEALDNLAQTGSVIISAFTGAGKTVTAIYLAAVLGKKTLIMTNKKMLMEQWERSIEKFCPSLRVQTLIPKKTIKDPTSRFFIVNPLNVSKFSREFLCDIQVLIVDELHLIVSPKVLRNFFHVFPQFVIGLSATPIRFDSYNQCIPMFFGKEQISIPLAKIHRVFTINTGYVPPIVNTPRGLDWNAVLDGQATDVNRNTLICNILAKLSSRHWLVLVKRVIHAHNIAAILNSRGIACELLVGSTQDYDAKCNILIGTTSKVGVGFDNPNIDALFVATDMKAYFIQSLGRCMRRPDVNPIVVDLIDSFNPLIKHFKERLKVYREHGGIVKELKLDVD